MMHRTERLQAALVSYAASSDHDHSDDRMSERTTAARASDQGFDSDSDMSAPAGVLAAGLTTEHARRFILGGKAIFTLVGVDSRYTYRVAQGDARPGDRPGTVPPFFVSLLTGPDNTSEYTYAGILDQCDGSIRLTRASKYAATSKPVAAFNWVMRRLWAGQPIAPAGIYHCGRCARCGRLLTVPSSIVSGFGPECLAKMSGGAQ